MLNLNSHFLFRKDDSASWQRIFWKKLNLKWKRGAEYPATWFRSGRFAYLQNLWMIIMRLMEFMIVETSLCQNGIDLHVTFYLAHGIWFCYGSLSWQLCSAKRTLKEWRIFYAWLLRKYVTHPAGTSDRSDICKGFHRFLIEVLQWSSMRKNIFESIHKQPITLQNYILP